MVDNQPYQPLDATRQETRILLITNIDPPEFDFEYASMDGQVEPFDAISWCWGDTSVSKQKTITIRGHSLLVPGSAHEVLLELCIAQKKRRVWIDAVCIRQDDTDERSQQVAMMRTIYRKATMTLVWLGMDDGTAETSVQMIKNIADWRQVKLQHTSRAMKYGVFFDESASYPFPHDIDWSAVRSFFSAPWFTRLWIIQEVVLSKHVHVFLGNYQMCWRYLVQAAHYILHNLSSTEKLTSHSRSALFAITMIGKIKDIKVNPLHLLEQSFRFGATDPRDRVFALYGLLETKGPNKAKVALCEAFSPAYRLPLVEIYTNATRAAIISSSELNLLLQAQCLVQRSGCPHPDTDFPSWVPRYHFVHHPARGSYRPVSGRAASSKDSQAPACRVDTETLHSILRIAGVVMDTISGVCEQLLPPSSTNNHITSGYCCGFRCQNQPCIEYRTTILRMMAQQWDVATAANPHVPSPELATIFRKTLLMELDEGYGIGYESESDYRPTFRHFVDRFWPTASNAPTESDDVGEGTADPDDCDLDNEYSDDDELEPVGQLPASPSDTSHTGYESVSLETFWDHIIERHFNRRLFVTSNGRMGSAAPRAQTGDKICLLSGLRVPVVLRQVDGDWVFIGDAYLSGPVNVRTELFGHLPTI